jgi:hypothetical protein
MYIIRNEMKEEDVSDLAIVIFAKAPPNGNPEDPEKLVHAAPSFLKLSESKLKQNDIFTVAGYGLPTIPPPDPYNSFALQNDTSEFVTLAATLHSQVIAYREGLNFADYLEGDKVKLYGWILNSEYQIPAGKVASYSTIRNKLA